MNKKKNNKILNFPTNSIESQRQIEAILFAAEEPLDIESIQERLTNYDPAAERKKAGNKEPITFGEFIFSNTPFAIRDAKKALFKESEAAKKKADLDSKEVQGKTVEEDSGSEVDTRKKYKPLISNPKLIPSFISSEIKTKLANVAGKLKSKLSDIIKLNL